MFNTVLLKIPAVSMLSGSALKIYAQAFKPITIDIMIIQNVQNLALYPGHYKLINFSRLHWQLLY